MFKGLKNKIKEETGSDVSKITPLMSNAISKAGIFKGRHSRQGSTSSVSSLSIDGISEEVHQPPTLIEQKNGIVHDDGKLSQMDVKPNDKQEENWRKKLNKLDIEWKRKLDEKEKEWRAQLHSMEEEKLKNQKSIDQLEKALLEAEEFKEKYCRFQEEKEQLDEFQTQEMAKVKHLLLAKEQELSQKLDSIKECNLQIVSLKSEVSRLRRFEEEISNVQDEMETLRHSSEQERTALRSELAQSEENVRHLRDRVAVLEKRTNADCVALGAPLTVDERVQGLLAERTLLERRLEEAHLHLADIKSSWSSKITSLETQVGRLCRQAAEEGAERRRTEEECAQLRDRVQQMELDLANASEVALEKKKLAQEIDHLHKELDSARSEKEITSKKLDEVKMSLENEVKRLREELDEERHSVSQMQLKIDETVKLENEMFELQKSVRADKEQSQACIDNLQHQLDTERLKNREIIVLLEREKNESDAAAKKSAEVYRQVELSEQSLKAQDIRIEELVRSIENLKNTISLKDQELLILQEKYEEAKISLHNLEREKEAHKAASAKEQELQEAISDLESQLMEKNKNIKQLQQRLGDLKKTVQRELNLHPSGFGLEYNSNGAASSGSASEDTSAAVLAPSSSHQVSQRRLQQQAGTSSVPDGCNDVNFQYLKHVLMKFLTSREYEAKHLTRAVATLLHFSPEEEKLLRETLEWKMSWFGSRPNLGYGQTAKTIPPS